MKDGISKHSLTELSCQQKAGWGRSCALFFILFIILAIPAFFRSYYVNSEEHVSFFSAAYGLRLFYPGQNRILSVLPFITSWLGAPRFVAAGHLFLTVCLASAAVSLFARFLPRSVFYPFSIFWIVAIVIFFGGSGYNFHISSANPYVVPFSLALMGCTLLCNVSIHRSRFAFWVVVSVISIAGAGINPSSSLLSMIFLTLCIAAIVANRLVTKEFSLRAAAAAILENLQIVFGILLNCFATSFILWLSSQYQRDFSQYVMSNYSVTNYTDAGLSFARLKDSFLYLTEFHGKSGVFSVEINESLVALACLSGLPSAALYFIRRQKNPPIAQYYLAAFLMWASALLLAFVLSQNSHVQLVQNFIQGRYYTIALYVFLLSGSLTGAAAVVDFVPGLRRFASYRADRIWFAGCTLLLLATSWLQFARAGYPTIEWAQRSRWNSELAEKIRKMDVQAIAGNYWWIWEIQYEFNEFTRDTPMITPVTIRTEAFGLKVFKPIIARLAGSKTFRFVCVELKEPPAGYEGACLPQIASYRAQGGFPLGDVRELSRSEVNRYKLTLYEMSLANPADPADCTASQILLRAKPVSSAVSGQDSYMLDEDSFVYLQRPDARADWVLRFTQDGREEVVIAPGIGPSYFHILNHRIAAIGEGCRLLVTVSRRDNLFPRTMKLDVR